VVGILSGFSGGLKMFFLDLQTMIKRLCACANSSPACANYKTKKTVEGNRINASPETLSTITSCAYVDDCLETCG